MPLVLSEGKWRKWLDPSSTQWDIQELMKPYDEGKLVAHEISKLITSRTLDSDVPEVLEPLPPNTLI
jgi:putative SOS response-associated peptidase YedK